MSKENLTQIRLVKRRFYDLQMDLLQSKHFNFDNNLKIFVEFCETNPVMKQIIEPLKNNPNTDIKEWWKNLLETGGSFIGSKRYTLPSDPNDETSLLYKFILSLNAGTYDVPNFALNVYGADDQREAYYEFNNDITRKLVRGLIRKLDALEERAKQPSPTETKTPTHSGDKKSVFVVHGRNLKARDALCQFLRSIGLKPIEWSQAVLATKKTAPYIGEVLDQAFGMAQAVVILMTPDDEGKLLEKYQSTNDPEYEKELTPQSRLNVIFEAGIAMGRNQNRTVLIELGKLRPFSDIGGRHVIRIDNSSAKRQDLAQRLQNAGCEIDLSGTDWHTCGDFVIS
jgi:predicted nucleotide-binding protein